MKQFFEEFKKFIARGNVIDLAVGILIGTSFNKVVTSLVQDIIMPPLGMLIGKVSFTDLQYVFPNSTVAIKYGSFIQTIVDFLIIAFSVFVVIRVMNRLMKKKEEAKEEPVTETVVEPTRQELLLEEIRDLLRVRR